MDEYLRIILTALISAVIGSFIGGGFGAKSAFGALVNNLRDVFAAKKEHEKLAEEVAAFRPEIAKLNQIEVKVGVFWSIIEKEAAHMLHRDDTPEIDRLLDRLIDPRVEMDAEELGVLAKYMDDIKKDKNRSSGEQTAAILLKAAVFARMISEYGRVGW